MELHLAASYPIVVLSAGTNEGIEMFKATQSSIKANIQSIGEMQQWGVIGLNESFLAVNFLKAVAEADDMEAKAVELRNEVAASLATATDPRTITRLTFTQRELNNLFA